MLIPEYLKTLTCRRKSNSRRRLARPHDFSEYLESRTLLTGNVQVSLFGENAQLTGDAANNEIQVVVDNGSIVVRGLNGTTINQGTTAFTLVTGATTLQGSLTASLGSGDDILTIGPGISFTGNVSLSGDGGADTLQALTGTYGGQLALNGNDGATSIVVDGAMVSGNLDVRGQGATLASISNSTVHGRLDVITGGSADSVVVQSTTVDGVTAINTGDGDDNVVLQNSTLRNRLAIEAGTGNDVVYVNSSSVAKLARIALRRGNDTVQVLGSSSFGKRLVVAGGLGSDAASIASDTTARRVVRRSIRSSQVDAALISSRITDPTTGAIARANALRTAAVPTLTASVSPATISENSGASASTLTVTRTGPTTADQIVTLTSSSTSKVTVPATVTIPIGQTTATATIAAIDNGTVDGATTVTITASSTGFANATTTLTVNDNEAGLTVNASPATFSENAGASASTLTVTRTGPTTAAQIVTLTSSNTSKATVPATVTIPIGQTTATATIAAIDNITVDNAATVTITASATGFANATTTLTVSDNETALIVSANPDTFSENAGASASTLTVTRTGLTTADQIVTLTSSNTNKVTVPATVTILAGQATATATISAIDNSTVDGATTVTITASATGIPNASATLTVNDNETALSLSASPATFSENAGTSASTLTVTRTGPTTAAQIVTLTSSNTSKATVPATVTIPIGQTTATATIAAIDNGTVDGATTVTITASATGFANATTTLTVNDNETALTVSASPAIFSENGGTTASVLTVTRTGPTTSAQIVTLTSSNTSKATVPATVTILVGNTVATVDIAALDNNVADGSAAVVITASATGFANATTTLTVTDNEPATLIVTPGTSTIAENAVAGTVIYTVARNTADTSSSVVVNLVSGNARLGVSAATVTIPVGQASTTFQVIPVNNALLDGNIDVQLTASAAGFADGTWTTTVVDDDGAVQTPTLTVALSPLSIQENAINGSTLTVTRPSGSTAQALVVSLIYSNTTRLSGPATITIGAGEASGTATLMPIDNLSVDGNANVDVSASAAGFATGQELLSIIDNETTALSVTTASSTVSETSGTLAGTIATSFASSAPLVVSLSYQNSSVLTGPASVTIPAGALSVPVTFTIVDGGVQDGNIVARVTAGASGAATGVKDVTVTDADTMALNAVITAADIVQSNNTRITRDSTSQVTGLTTAGATITVDRDGDGLFDDGSATAGVDGTFTVDVTLLHTATNHGENRLIVKSVSGANSADTVVNAHLAVGTVVHFATNHGAYDVELLNTEAPLTVANFLSYVDSGAYQNVFVHRTNSGSARFIQSGGFKVNDGQVSSVPPEDPITNEFELASNSNVAGTLSMALAGTKDSGTSQWFVNTSDNAAAFDSGLYTIFGRVIGDGLTVASGISDLTQRNLNTLYNSTALATVPLSDFNPANTPITGTVAITSNSAQVTGTGTLFTTELAVGQSIVIGSGRAFFVASIQSDTLLTLTATAPSTGANLTVTKDVVPSDDEFVVFSSIGKILDTI